MITGYNNGHWRKQLQKYLDQDWSHNPSPFGRTVSGFLKPHSNILELGSGAGQDGLWLASQGHKVCLTDATDTVFDEIRKRAAAQNITNTELAVLDITEPFTFPDKTFDMVYAQLVLHYFDDKATRRIIEEIRRVLKPGGILACLLNSINDPEYDSHEADEQGIIQKEGLSKRYFSVESFRPFVADFEELLFNNNGHTPKDDVVGTSGLIQFVGRCNG